MFTTTVEISNLTDWDSCKHLDVKLELQLDGATENVKVGFLSAFIVDKTVDETGAEGAGDKAWVAELLCDSSDNRETATVMRALYTQRGTQRKLPALRAYKAQLDSDRVCVIDTLILEAQYRSGKGIGPMALDGFHELLSSLGDGLTVLLSPGVPRAVQQDYADMDGDDAEDKLAAFYEKSGGYQHYLNFRTADKGWRRVMGRRV